MFSEIINIEIICFKEFIILIKRDIRYFYFVLSMYLRSLVSIKDARLLRATYCLIRHIDDVIDGDRKSPKNPITFVQDISHQISTENFHNSHPISKLAAFMMKDLELRYDNKAEVKASFLSMIDLLIEDYFRIQKKLVLSEEDIDNRLFQVLFFALDITLIISRSKIRSFEITDLINAQVYLYTIRDVKKDLSKDLINIPDRVLDEAKCHNIEKLVFSELVKTDCFQKWIKFKFKQGESFLKTASDNVKVMQDRRAKMILGPIVTGLKLYVWRNKRRMRNQV